MMSSKKAIVLFFVFVCMISCETKKSFNTALIQKISNESSGDPSYFGGILFFCKSDNDKVLLLDVQELRELYNKYSKENVYSDFLMALLNQEIIIPNDGDRIQFSLNEGIKAQYDTLNFNDFFQLYCKKKNDNKYTIIPDLSESERNTLFYFLFINNYLVVFNDYTGFYSVFNSFDYYK